MQVSDRDAFLCARRVAAVEGILIGGSGGMAVQAALTVADELTPDKTVLVILPDGGRPYLSKVFDDDWMRSHGLLDRPGPAADGRRPHARQVDARRPGFPSIVTIAADAPGSEAIDLLQRYGISQLPVRGAGLDGRRGERRRPRRLDRGAHPCSTASSARAARCSRDRSRS